MKFKVFGILLFVASWIGFWLLGDAATHREQLFITAAFGLMGGYILTAWAFVR